MANNASVIVTNRNKPTILSPAHFSVVGDQIIAVAAPFSASLNDLSDVVITAPASGSTLSYNGVDWVNTIPTLDSLSDVTITTPASGSVLAYNGSQWVNAPTSSVYATDINNTLNTVPLRDPADNGSFEVGGLQFDTTDVSADGVGKVLWNDAEGTIQVGLKGGNVTLQIGQENVIHVRNDEAFHMTDGQVVYTNGSTGIHQTVKLADADLEATSETTLGIVTEHIAKNKEGFITTFGLVRNINTHHLTEGYPVYLSSTAGATTSTRPIAPAHAVFLGYCVRKHISLGSIFVNIDPGAELSELHDVVITAPASGSVLSYDGAVWRNATPTVSSSNITGIIPVSNGGTGTGTAFTPGSIVFAGPSGSYYQDNPNFFFDDANNRLGLGPTPATRLHVRGSAASDIITSEMGLNCLQVAPPANNSVTAVLAGVGAGNVDNGTHQYYCSFYTATGETTLAKYSLTGYGYPVTVVDKTTNGKVVVTFPVSTDVRVIGRRIYRSGIVNGYSDVRLVADIANNIATSTTDNLSDASKTGLEAFTRDNTTNKFITIDGVPVLRASLINTFLGYESNAGLLAGTSVGGYNTSVGYRTGYNLTAGTRNTLMGYSAGQALTTGFDNTIIGDSAALSNQTGYSSVLIGRNVNGSHNGTRFCTYIGNSVNQGGSTGQQTANVAIGHQAMNGLTTGGNSIAIGAYANQNQTAYSACITIGAYCDLPSAALHGQLNIGNVLYGLGIYNANAFSSTPTLLGKIGIGITTPTAVLHLKAGTATAGTAPLKIAPGSLLTAPEIGSIEVDTGDKIYHTITTSTARKEIALCDAVLTPSSAVYATTNGRLTTTAPSAGPGSYGSMWADDISQLVGIASSMVYVKVPSSFTGSYTNNMTFQNASELKVLTAGKYLVNWSMSMHLATGGNRKISGAIMVNTTAAQNTEASQVIAGTLQDIHVSGTGIVSCAVNDVIGLCVENETSADDIIVTHGNMTALFVGV